MIKPYNSRITKAALDMSEECSSKTLEATQNHSVFMLKKEALSERILTKNHKRAALFVRNCLRQALHNILRIMLSRLLLKKISYSLLTSKRKREMEWAFLTIRKDSIAQHHRKLNNCLLKCSEAHLFGKIFTKMQSRRIVSSMNIIKNMTHRRKKLQLISHLLAQSTHRLISRVFFQPAIAKLRTISATVT